ncbi:hypothetical protein E2P81_ATG03958 [Venturia nashicola]|nr:hypothetical protein E2P81_ATG03958 [Venturia nashicola]
MAPQPGGSGGLDIRQVQNRCAFSDTIATTPVAARLAIDGTALALLLVIPWLWSSARRKNPNLDRLLTWHTLGILLFMDALYIVLDILDTVLFNCFIFGLVEYTSLNVALSVLSELSNLLALGIILMPMTLHILHRAGQKNKIVIIINGTALGAVALLMVPFLVVNNMSSIGSESTNASFQDAAHTFAATYYTTYFVAAVIGFLLLFFSLVKAARDFAITLQIKIWTIFTTSLLLLVNLAVVIETYGWAITNKDFSGTAWICFVALFQFLFVLTIFGILQTAISVVMPYVDPTHNATYDPDAHETLVPAVHKRFTYIGEANEPKPSPGVYETQEWLPTSTRSPSNEKTPPTYSYAL